jgi:hypothetical protein
MVADDRIADRGDNRHLVPAKFVGARQECLRRSRDRASPKIAEVVAGGKVRPALDRNQEDGTVVSRPSIAPASAAHGNGNGVTAFGLARTIDSSRRAVIDQPRIFDIGRSMFEWMTCLS